jgi:hypothetical protein
MDKEKFISIVSPFSMTSLERISSLYDSLEYIKNNKIEGDFVECGVWRGGNILGIMEYLKYNEILNRNIWLYDTFEGMTESEDVDVDHQGINAKELLHLENVKAYASIQDVKNNLSISSFPVDNIKYIVGDVVNTLNILHNIPNKISLLRLDTDWYKSTKKELEILYPKLSNKGVLIVDDYGHWKGSKKAVDEYFKNIDITIKNIDYTGIKIIKK